MKIGIPIFIIVLVLFSISGFLTIVCAQEVVPYEIQIEIAHNSIQGSHEQVSVTLNKGSEDLLGFDLMIAYDNSALSFAGAAQGATREGYEVPLAIINSSTGIADENALLPSDYSLHQNYPNPFNNRTVINFDLPRAENVVFEIINLLGQTVYRMENRYSAGSHSIPWNGIDNQGRPVTSGVYYYRIIAGDFIESKKMILLK